MHEAQQATAGQRVTEQHDAVRFIKAIFHPQDLILFRPIETWKEDGKKRSEVDYPGIRYERFGGRAGDEWLWHDSRMVSAIKSIIARTEQTRCNLFFGTCPRIGSDGKYDLAWQIRTVRAVWADIDDALPDVAIERCNSNGVPRPSIVISSGNGTHLYWVLSPSAQIDDAGAPPPVHTEFIERGEGKSRKRQLYLIEPHSKERLSLDARQNVPSLSPRAQMIQDIVAGIAGKIGGDHTIDLSRILRIPGTLNRKDQRNGRAPTPCILVDLNDARYSLADLMQFASTSPAKTKRAKIAQVPLPCKKSYGGKLQGRMRDLIAACAAAEVGRRSEADFAVCCFGVEVGQPADAVWGQVENVGKFAEEGRRYFDLTWEAAQSHTRERIFNRAVKKEKQRTEKKDKAEAGSESLEPISNGFRDEDDDESPTLPLEIGAIIASIFERTDNWPRRIGASLFVHDKGRSIDMLSTPAALFGWLGAKCGIVKWEKGVGFTTKEELFAELCRSAKEYKAIEYLPHWPPIEDHYYACEFPPPGNGGTIKRLLDRFCPETLVDRKLILLMFATPFWGGRGGQRPGFIITSTGRGAGKSKMTELASRLCGGYIEVREYEDASVMRQRLLSEEAMPKRIARLDNVKSLKFSWSDLESTMTAEILSGKRMYYGETSRPNTLTWFMTLNGISLSTDMAQRCVIIRVLKPKHEGNWENETVAFMEKHRQELIGDILGFLQIEDSASLGHHSRWGAWESSMLCKFPNAEEIQHTIIERSETADTEFEEAALLEEYFEKCLEELGYETSIQKVHIPSKIAADWYRSGTNNRKASDIAASKIINQFCEEGRLTKIGINPSRKYGRGFLWVGNSDADADYDLQDKIEARKKAAHGEKTENRYWEK